MISVFDKLNLRPVERRLVVVAAIVLFVVLNIWLVFPKFKDWKMYQARLTQAEKDAAKYADEIKNIPAYNTNLAILQNDGNFVPTEEQALSLVQTILTKAAEANVMIQRTTPAGGGDVANNPFFVEQRVTVIFGTGEKELVDFLVKLGLDNSLIRVRDLEIKPDPSQQKLAGTITILGRYLKKPGSKQAGSGAPVRPPPRPGQPGQ